jgi:hypothetical protein
MMLGCSSMVTCINLITSRLVYHIKVCEIMVGLKCIISLEQVRIDAIEYYNKIIFNNKKM